MNSLKDWLCFYYQNIRCRHKYKTFLEPRALKAVYPFPCQLAIVLKNSLYLKFNTESVGTFFIFVRLFFQEQSWFDRKTLSKQFCFITLILVIVVPRRLKCCNKLMARMPHLTAASKNGLNVSKAVTSVSRTQLFLVALKKFQMRFFWRKSKKTQIFAVNHCLKWWIVAKGPLNDIWNVLDFATNLVNGYHMNWPSTTRGPEKASVSCSLKKTKNNRFFAI